jgi:hypothetical protein
MGASSPERSGRCYVGKVCTGLESDLLAQAAPERRVGGVEGERERAEGERKTCWLSG